MKFLLTIFLLININLLAQETTTATENMLNPLDINNSFITKFEYGKMLYNNPRGIGCNSCHGDDAKGKKIIDFKQEHDKKIYNCNLSVPNIKDIDYAIFSEKKRQFYNFFKIHFFLTAILIMLGCWKAAWLTMPSCTPLIPLICPI